MVGALSKATAAATLLVFLGPPSIARAEPMPGLPPAPVGLQRSVVCDHYSPLSRSVELARRTLSPLTNLELSRASAAAGTGLRPQSIDLGQEAFTVYVPAKQPAEGYGLLAFIPPWQAAHLPEGWTSILDQHGIIFVSASKSGNDENVLDRRIPLALLGAYNVMQRYAINDERVYIGGFSGGSRVALRAALAYPDLFHGVFLNAGSDPIGNMQALLPPDKLFLRFQTSTRLVDVTGTMDEWNTAHDVGSRASLQEWCVFDVGVETMARVGHEIATPSAFDRALTVLDRGPPGDSDKAAACRARLHQELAQKLQHVGELVHQGESRDARRALTELDTRYGGLAAPQSIDLAQRIAAHR
jgi:hypothetical protein